MAAPELVQLQIEAKGSNYLMQQKIGGWYAKKWTFVHLNKVHVWIHEYRLRMTFMYTITPPSGSISTNQTCSSTKSTTVFHFR